MKKTIILILAIAFISPSIQAQIGMGMKFGLSSFEMMEDNIILKGPKSNQYVINYKGAKYGLHFGLYGDFQFSAFSIHPSVIFNTTKIDYKLEDLNADKIVRTLKIYNNLDVPVLLGVNFGRIRIHAGPVAHISLGSIFEIIESDDYQEKFTTATYGYQAGLSLRLLENARVEVNYEGNLEPFGEHFIYRGTEYQFESRPHRFVLSLLMGII